MRGNVIVGFGCYDDGRGGMSFSLFSEPLNSFNKDSTKEDPDVPIFPLPGCDSLPRTRTPTSSSSSSLSKISANFSIFV